MDQTGNDGTKSPEQETIAETNTQTPSEQEASGKIKSKVRMDSVKAEAIARLRSTDIPDGCGLQCDVDPHGTSDVEVVFKERTAL